MAAALLLAAISNPHATLVALQALAATIRAWATPDDPTPAELHASVAAAIDAGVDFSDSVSAQFAPGGRWDGQLPERVAELVRLRLSRIAGGAILVLALLFGGGAAQAATVNVAGTGFGVTWIAGTPAGDHYEVFVARRTSSGVPADSEFAKELTGGAIQAAITGTVGQYITVRVRACLAGGVICSPLSTPSDQIRLVGFPPPPGTPAMPTVLIRCEDPAKPTPVLNATTGVISCQ